MIVCDIMMPELDGYGVLHILNKKKETAAIPFIFLTAKTERTDIRKGMTLGADDYLTKPFSDTELLDAIETRLKKQSIRTKDYQTTSEGLDNFITDAKKALNLQELCTDKKTKLYKKKGELFTEDDTPRFLFFLQQGSVKTFKSHPDGKELITNLYKTGDFFGFEPLLESHNYLESAIALEDSNIVSIPKDDFLTLLNSHADVAASFIGMLCKKVSKKEQQLLNLAYNSVRQRTAEALLKLNQLNAGKDKITISREDLAKMIGTAAESVIRVLSDFKDEGLIEIETSKIKICQTARLEKVVRWNVAR
jgi:CRP-like cAMP-binding protein